MTGFIQDGKFCHLTTISCIFSQFSAVHVQKLP